MTKDTSTSQGLAYYWVRRPEGESVPPGEHLAAMRRGMGAEPGSVPAMWPFYSRLTVDGHITKPLRAEHIALTLLGVHQQSQTRSMHWPGVRLGEALRALRVSGRYSEQAVDRRFAQCATADSVAEFAHHLRGLVSMLKTLSAPQGLDYSKLVDDLIAWQYPARIGAVRRQLGSDYFRIERTSTDTSNSRKDSRP